QMRPREALVMRFRAMASGLLPYGRAKVNDNSRPARTAYGSQEDGRKRPVVTIVQNFPDPTEIGAIQLYLKEKEIDSFLINQDQLTFDAIKNSDLVIWNDLGFGMEGITDKDVLTYLQAHEARIPLYFIGDDLASSMDHLRTSKTVWSDLLHLRYGTNGAFMLPVRITTPSHAVVQGPYGSVGDFTYASDSDEAQATSTGEVVLGTYEKGTVLVAHEHPQTGVRTVTQNFMVFNDSDPHGIVERRKLFLNAVAWLLASPIKTRMDRSQ
ncbi:MAG TPA: hypothetical protein VFS19_07075, partial [Planctomycetota bacterium]|nr:hypothetical protein [Planctomycetota bacterium]